MGRGGEEIGLRGGERGVWDERGEGKRGEEAKAPRALDGGGTQILSRLPIFYFLAGELKNLAGELNTGGTRHTLQSRRAFAKKASE